MKNLPKVSICIPTFNSERYLRETLISIENQTYDNIEVIICDNCSTDGTINIVKSFSKKNNWTYILNDVNIGAGLNMNKLISHANGELIAIYHSDDIYDSEIVAKSVDFMESNPTCGFVSTLGKVIDSNGKELYDLVLPRSLMAKNRNIYTFEEMFSSILDSFLPFLITPTVMVRRDMYDNLGDFKIHRQYKSAGDYEMWLRILKEFPAGILPYNLINYRKHAQQGSQKEIRENYGLPDSLIVYEEYSRGNKFLEKKYKRAYSYLLMLQVLKLNENGNFNSSSEMVNLIQKNGNFRYKILSKLFNFLNIISISFKTKNLNMIRSVLTNNN